MSIAAWDISVSFLYDYEVALGSVIVVVTGRGYDWEHCFDQFACQRQHLGADSSRGWLGRYPEGVYLGGDHRLDN